MADENKPAFYPRVGNIKAKNFKPAKPMPFIDDERAMDLPQYVDVDLSQPTKANLEMGRRMAERDAQLRRQAEADRSPLEKLAGGVQAGRFLGSALTQAINSAPTRLFKGDEAADKFMQERMYKPEQPLAYEYAGDVGDFLERLETQYKLPPILPEAVALQYLTGPATSQATRAAGKGAVKAGMALERGMEPVVRGALERGGLPREMALAMGANSQSNVIKPKGGNWLGGNVDGAMRGLKRDTMMGAPGDTVEDVLKKKDALNNWVDRNLTNYVKKEMATPEDPVRNLAEQGVTHFPIAEDPTYWARKGESSRKEAGGNQMALSDLAKQWENRSDAAINAETALQHQDMMHLAPGMYTSAEDWIKKLPPDTKLYNTRGSNFNPADLGFDHIMDVLRQDVREGRIRPEQLNKVSMEQAVRRTYEYDQEMAKRMRETALKQQEGFPLHKEYPEGYRWIELTQPKAELEQGHVMGRPSGYPDLHAVIDERTGQSVSVGATPDEAMKLYKRQDREKVLEDALKYEGDTMGHCVGGYCPDVLEGRSRIFSLRDAKGEPHVTIEVGKAQGRTNYDDMQAIYNQAQQEANEKNFATTGQFNNYYNDRVKELQFALIDKQKAELPERIVQIKGKGNAKPKDDYIPYVQDFVRSGNWSDVGDIKNTGLYKLDKDFLGQVSAYMPEAEDIKHLKQPQREEAILKAMEANELKSGYITRAEYENAVRKYGSPTYGEVTDDLLRQLQAPIPPDLEGMKRGGVAISKNPDAMMLELNDRKMAKGGITKILKGAASEAERALPLRLTRAMPKPLSEINAHAERVARQMMGEHVTSGKAGDTKNLAGRSMKESQRVKALEYEFVPTKDVPESQVVESKLGDINVALPGDFTVSDVELKSLMGEPIGSRQEGGSRYGLGHLEDELPLFYASNEGPAQQVQNKVTELADLYGPERIMGHHMAMGPIATNFAQHFADANLRRIDYSKLRPADMYQFDKILSEGFVLPKKDKKTGQTTYKVVDFPDWPGIVDPQAAYFAMKQNPEMRKWFNKLMQTPKITEPLGLPNAQDVRYAITSPDLRDMEVNLTGHGVGELVPNAELTDTADHNTYLKGIRGIYKGHQDVLSPFPISFADAAQHIISTQRPQDFTGTIQKVFPHQIVDQQYLDEMGAYRKRLKELTGKKEGGAIKKPAAYIDGNEFVLAAQKYGIKDSMNNLNKIVDLVNKGLSVDDAARQVADTGMHKAAGGAITGDDLIIEERPL